MPRRYITSLDPWQQEQDELDRLYEHAPANERPLFPPSPSPLLSPRARGERRGARSPLDDTSGLRAAVPHTKPQE